MTDALKSLLETARKAETTPEQREKQRRSFAFGNNTAFENSLITLRRGLQHERQIVVVEFRVPAQLMLGYRPKHPREAVEVLLALCHIYLQAVMHLRIKIFEQFSPRVLHSRIRAVSV